MTTDPTADPVPADRDALLEHLTALHDRIASAPIPSALRLELRSAVADAGLAVERLLPERRK